MGGVGEWMELYRPMGGHAGGDRAGRNKARSRQKKVSALVCLSLAPDPHSLSYHLISSSLNDLSAQSHSLSQMYVVCKDQVTAAGETCRCVSENWWQLLDSEQGCGCPWPQNQLRGGTGRSKASEGLGANGWSVSTGHSPCANCWG